VSRSPNAAAATKIDTPLGTEPVNIVEVDWTGSTSSYADKDFLDVRGTILSISGLDTIIKLGASGSSGSLNVVLDDTDGTIKDILNNFDVHKQAARVYQSYEGLLDGDKFLIFSGQVSSPITWNEGDRTVSFTIINIIEDRLLGFAPEDGEFDFIAESAIGVAWPLAFGDVVRVPAVKLTEAVRGTSLTRYGQITSPGLESLCGAAITAQQAETAKKVADNIPGFTDGNYGTVIDNLTSALITLNQLLNSLIFDSPTQESNLREYVDVCKELERWRNFQDENLAALEEAENDIIPLESTSGKGSLQVEKQFTPDFPKNVRSKTSVVFSPSVLAAYRLGTTIPQFDVTIRSELPASIGLVEQAQIALSDFIAAFWVYTTPEQWERDAILTAAVSVAQADLNDALARSNTASSNISLANLNIKNLNGQKKSLENDLMKIVLTFIDVDGGEKFPQGVETEIVVNGMHFKGTFSGRSFTISALNTPADINVAITSGNEPDEFNLVDPTIQLKGKYLRLTGSVNGGLTYCENQDGALCSISPILYKKTGNVSDIFFDHDIYDPVLLSGVISQTSVFLSKEWIDNTRGASGKPDFANGLSNIRQRDYSIAVGDTVYLATDFSEIYVANLIPSTAIHEVMAYRTIDQQRKLVPVPSRYYTIDLNEAIAGQNSTTIRFNRPLTEYFGEAWEDKIFVSLTSTVGPNTVDIIEYLVNTYTDLTVDAATFASVRAAIDPFPSHFAFLDRRGTLGAIEDIAWQARCAAFVKGQTIFLKYLALAEASVDTIDESIIDVDTLEITLTPTEELVTEFVADWDSDYSAERRNQTILRNNIPIYGTNREEFDFFIYNIQSLVVKSATFWLIRYSNTWKIANFQTPISMLRLETLDTISLDLANDIIASSSVQGSIEEVLYDSDTRGLKFKVRTEVRSGFLTPYVFVWPAGVDVSIVYPTPNDPNAGIP
jgi:hypothetical protein